MPRGREISSRFGFIVNSAKCAKLRQIYDPWQLAAVNDDRQDDMIDVE
jgi:hypothetical protein